VVLWLIAQRFRLSADERPLFVLLLAQGGEFAFVLLALGVSAGAMAAPDAQAIILAVALSMLTTPFLLVAHDRWLLPRIARTPASPEAETPEEGEVIIAGLGRVGQVVARILHASGVHASVLDDDPDHVEQTRKLRFRVFYGDSTRLDLLHAAGAARAKLLVVTLDDADAVTRLVRTAKEHFPNLRIVARARDMRHAFALRDLGVELIERETWLGALRLGELALAEATGDPARAQRATRAFAEHDNEVQARLYAVHRDAPDAHISVSNELRDQIARTLAEDEAKIRAGTKPT
jgi:glutathione-regulated potassium-efflux system ancillary protein KefC